MTVPTGFTCVCGAKHKFGVYVFAHLDIPLTFQCEHCQARYTITGGKAIQDKTRSATPTKGN